MTEQSFEDYVKTWDNLVGRITQAKKDLKLLTDSEMVMRKGIAGSVGAAMTGGLKEGVNTFPMPDGRKLKVTRKVKREIDEALIGPTREAYALLNDNPVVFDTLLRVKYELAKAEWDKLEGEAALVVSRMITSKDESPTVVLD